MESSIPGLEHKVLAHVLCEAMKTSELQQCLVILTSMRLRGMLINHERFKHALLIPIPNHRADPGSWSRMPKSCTGWQWPHAASADRGKQVSLASNGNADEGPNSGMPLFCHDLCSRVE